MKQKSTADLRTCASCEWIYKVSVTGSVMCPKCGFGSYSAHYVYQSRAYAFARTQQPWYDRKMAQWQKRQDLLDAIQAQVNAWRQENEKVSAMLRDCIFSQSQQLGIVAHMHERSKCANALEDVWQAHRDKE